MEVKKNNNKKIIILGIILLVLAGIIIVALKGLNVSLMFGKHENIEIKLDTEVNINVINEICEEVFADKKFVVKELEVFGDSAQINVGSITDEEKNNLVEKINEKFGTTKTVDDLNIYALSNKRIRDVLKIYVKPMIISFIVVFVYILIRFRKINSVKIIIDLLGQVILTESILLSLIAIIRIPVSDLVINLFMVIAVAELVYTISKNEKKLENLEVE